jgi:hypothetical protein
MVMKRSVIAAVMAALLIAAASPVTAAEWDAFAAQMQKRIDIKEKGAAILGEIRAAEPSGTEYELWTMLGSGDAKTRAAAGLALVDRIFPNGDPSRWEEAKGFLTKGGLRPRQIAAMDGLFTAIAALRDLPDGIWGAAYLLDQFGRSAKGKVKFIDEIPAEMRPVIDDILANTGLPGDWTSKKIRGKMPMLPIYRGYVSRETADSLDLQYLDGYGSIAYNGPYAWDRDRGYLYKISEGSRNEDIIID